MQNLFANLASHPRLSILYCLSEKERRISDVSEKLGMSMQALHRHVKTLQKSGLIRKDPTGHLSITNFGSIVLQQIPSFQFLWKHRKYFEEHSLDKLPLESIQTIGALNNCELLHGTAATVEKYKTMTTDADEYLKVVTGQVILDLVNHTAEKIRNGLKLEYVLGQNTVVSKKRREILDKIGWKKLVSEGHVKRKMANAIYVDLVITEKEAVVNFSRLDGTLNPSTCFSGSDPYFLNWALNLFENIWNQAGIFDDTKLMER